MNDSANTQALWPQMISALAAIDRELGLPDDGCNSLHQTLSAIRELKDDSNLKKRTKQLSAAARAKTH